MFFRFSILPFFLFFLFFSLSLLHAESLNDKDAARVGSLVKREERQSLAHTEFGEISAVKISDGSPCPYYLQFITLEPNSLFLPVLLHAGMVFYVRSGRGRLSWTDEGDLKKVQLKRGDIYRLQPGTVFFVESNLELAEREKLRIYAMFSNTEEEAFEPSIGAYTSINDLVLGFDKKVLASAFKVPEDVIEAITNATKPPAIVHALSQKRTILWQLEDRFLKAFQVGRGGLLHAEGINKRRTYNILDAKPDFQNCNGWSVTVDKKHLKLLKHTNIGLFMVNLTKGSMMGPHWNPMASELAVVLQGRGMVRVVSPNTKGQSNSKAMRFKVEEGDVFAVPRFHPMAQMSFNNDSFIFMGFSTSTKRNHPQFLAGKNSVMHALNSQILALSFNVTNTTIDQLLTPQKDSVILECTSCAEEEERAIEEEKEEEKKREEEEARKREEEEKKREEEEAKKREEEEKKKEEEEAKKREEEEKKREEEEAKRREEEEAKKREEEEKKREEEEAKKREEEEKKREEEEAKRKEEEEEEAAARKREEEEARKRAEEEAAREAAEEEARQREEEAAEEEAKKRAEEEEAEKREEEEARKREEEKREHEAARKREAAARREQEEARRQEEEREREEGGGGEEEQRWSRQGGGAL